MGMTNCEICGKVIPAAETPTGTFIKTYCGCDRQEKEKKKTRINIWEYRAGYDERE